MEDTERAGKEFGRLVKILERLRGKEGCPWDKEQDEKSIINFFLEEVYEVVDAVSSGNVQSLAEELGDVLMEIVFLAEIYKEKEKFSISDVLRRINQKMIRRHPHVFGRKHFKSSSEVYNEWQQQKKEEKERQSIFDGMSRCFPSLLDAFHIGLCVSSFGFDWSKPLDALQKVKEEICELEKALQAKKEEEIFLEIGDIIFSMANVSRLLGVNPEIALREANGKFVRRFKYVEQKIKDRGGELGQVSLEEMDNLWEESKDRIK